MLNRVPQTRPLCLFVPLRVPVRAASPSAQRAELAVLSADCGESIDRGLLIREGCHHLH
jgi:hypothetical protein